MLGPYFLSRPIACHGADGSDKWEPRVEEWANRRNFSAVSFCRLQSNQGNAKVDPGFSMEKTLRGWHRSALGRRWDDVFLWEHSGDGQIVNLPAALARRMEG